MTLADLRKLAIRQQIRIRFPLTNGMECVMNEHGVAQVPALKGVPDFNLDKELATVPQFYLDTVSSDPKVAVKTRVTSRAELETMAGGAPTVEVHDHDDE